MILDLETLRVGILGLTPEICSFCLQACTVCLAHSNHQSGVNAALSETHSDNIQLNWTSIVDEKRKHIYLIWFPSSIIFSL